MNNRQGFATPNSFAILYHAHHTRHPDDLAFFSRLAEQYGGPILELGCGTGRVALPLSQQGHRVLGLDADVHMLAHFHSFAKLPVFQADMAAFRLAIQFPLILLPCNTWSTLSATTRQATLARVKEHLAPNGIFVVSMPNPILLASLPRRGAPEVEEVFPHPLDGEPVQVSSAWLRGAHFLTFTWHYDYLRADGVTERVTAQARHELLSVEGYLAEFAAAGLKMVSLYGDFDESAYTPESSYLISLLSKENA